MADPVFYLSGKRIDKLKVDELKAELEQRGLKKSGNKGILVDRLQEFLEQESMERERLAYASSTPQDTFGNQYMYQNVTTAQNATPLQDVAPLQNITPLQNTGQEISPPPVKQSPLNQLPIPQLHRQYQQNFGGVPPTYGHAEQTQQYVQPQQLPQTLPGFPIEQIAAANMLQRSQLVQSPEKSDSESSSEDTESSDNNIQTQDSQEPSAQEVTTCTKPELVRHAPRPEQELSHQGNKYMDKNHSDENQEMEQSPNDEREEKDERTEKEDQSDEGEESSSSSADKELPKQEANTPAVDAGKQEEDVNEEDRLEDGEVDSPEAEEEKPAVHPFRHSTEASVDVEPSEDDKAIVGESIAAPTKRSRSPVIIKKRKLSVQRSSGGQTPSPSADRSTGRKRRWGSSSSTKKKAFMSISTDSLKDLMPGVQVQSTAALEALMDFGQDEQEEEAAEQVEMVVEQKEEDKLQVAVNSPEKEEVRRGKKDRIVKVEESRTIKIHHRSASSEVKDDGQQEGAKGSIIDDVKMEVDQETFDNPRSSTLVSSSPLIPDPTERSPSPALNPESTSIHLKNLVRPFTLNQLKELLGRNGTLEDGGFWIDRIKSHCYAVYSSVEEAVSTRKALHGVKWPTTSPKILAVDFAVEAEMFHDTGGALGKKQEEPDLESGDVQVEGDKRQVRKDQQVVTEEKMEEDEKSPANLLDNLFRKTKTLPCLYWLPLTDEQIAAKEKEREQRRKKREEERKKEEDERKERQKEREAEREKEKEREREREREREKLREERIKQREKERQRSLERARERTRARDRRRSSSTRTRSRRSRSDSSSSSSRSRSRERGVTKRR